MQSEVKREGSYGKPSDSVRIGFAKKSRSRTQAKKKADRNNSLGTKTEGTGGEAMTIIRKV